MVQRYAASRGVDTPEPSAEAFEAEAQVPIAWYYDGLEHLAAALSAPYLGVDLAFALGRQTMGALTFVMSTSETLGDALDAIFRHQAVLSPAERYTLTTRGERLHLAYFPHGPTRPAHALSAQFFVADVAVNGAALLGPQGFVVEIGWRVGELRGADPDELARRLGAAVHPPTTATAAAEVIVDAACLALPLPGANRAMHAFFDAYLEDRRPELAGELASLCAAIDARIADGPVALPSLARGLGMSARTLQRRLGELGLSSRQLIAERRLLRAKALLAAGRSPQEAALAAGYAQTSSLHRALRRARSPR
nr:helix-turn-helix domain-containing protein [Pseudenhygromyxa sp. WMMC2535]